MNEWLVSIVGVVFLGVMLDLIYPNGKTNKFCKAIFGIFVMFVMVSPVLKLKDSNYQIKIDEAYLSNIKNLQINNLNVQIENALLNSGFKGVDVEIEGNMIDNEIVIENVYVDISNLVLSEKLVNINKYEVITSKIKKITNIEESRIIIYG